MWWIIGALIVNDLLLAVLFYQVWKYNFGFHIIQCECGTYNMVTLDIKYLEECDDCHVCEHCGKWLTCKTCGRKELVRKEVDSIEFCNGIGCFEKYKKGNKENK